MGIQLNQKLTGAIGFTHIVTVTINCLTFQTTMKNLHINFVTGQKLIQKPSGNILTEEFRITVSRKSDVRHCPQCKNQTKDETKRSFSLPVIVQ